MLYHLNKVGGAYVIKYKMPVCENHKPSTVSLAYDHIDRETCTAIASHISGANGNDQDLTKHPWALHSIWRLSTSQDVAIILEWQPARAVPHIATVGSVVPVASSSTPTFIPLRPGDAGETASIL